MARSKARRKDFELSLPDGGGLARRASGLLPDRAFWFEDTLDIAGPLSIPVITGAAWLLELYALDTGTVSFAHGATTVQPATRCFGVFYAPFTLSQPVFTAVRGQVVGLTKDTPLPAALAAAPVVFDTPFTGRPASAAHALELVSQGRGQAITFNPCPSLLSLKAKRLLDDHYLIYPAIARLAARLGVSPAHLSRQFKRDFALTPSAYLRQLRVADAMLRLARGEPILDVSASVGYNDLSRFYKQFRAATLTSPGACRDVMQPSDP